MLLLEHGGPISPTKSWSNPCCIEWVCETKGYNYSPENFEAVKASYIEEIRTTIEFKEIPPELVINWDQTGPKLRSSFSLDYGKARNQLCKNERQITTVFTGTLASDFLPPQMI